MITNQDRAAIRRIFRKTKEETDRLLKDRVRQTGRPLAHEKMADVVAAQNALRACMEVVFNECLPYDEVFCGEMATRLAAFAISIVPIERQRSLLMQVARGLPAALAEKHKQGAIMRATWETGGVERPNVPDKSEVN